MKYLLSCLFVLLMFSAQLRANNYSYIYIEGDKQTPFYVKMEGQMQPRLGKNYSILSNLDAGVTYIEILFQQNAFPAQKFAINIPEASHRGFMLQKVNDRQFALYDMQQGYYIVSGNKPEDDQKPSVNQNTGQVAIDETAAATGSESLAEENVEKKNTATEENVPPVEASRFIDDIELNTGQPQEPLPAFKPATKKSSKPVKKTSSKSKSAAPLVVTAPIPKDLPAMSGAETEFADAPKKAPKAYEGVPNSDCRKAMTSDEFEEFALKILDESSDDDRLKVLKKNRAGRCFSTEQVRIIANNLSTQSGRFEVVKLLYPQTSDQGNYGKLEALFKTTKGQIQSFT